jgi:hypothetical protein
MTPYLRPVLYVNAEDFDAESAARRAAERDPGFVHISTIADAFLSRLRVAASAPRADELSRARDRTMRPVLRQRHRPALRRRSRRAPLVPRMGRTAYRTGPRRKCGSAPPVTA